MRTELSGSRLDCLAAAVSLRLPPGGRRALRADPCHGAVDVLGTPDPPGAVVLAAITDDHARHAVLEHAAGRARELGLPLRAVHVWDGHRPYPDLLLDATCYADLDAGTAAAVRREIRRDRHPAHALSALSHHAALLVVAATGALGTARTLGATAAALIGHTACPLTIVLPTR
ncbi:universal stress protein [Actinoplanes teichomyceticus]|uniref:Universal stress protein family protein n=1 Tax=Actinoplanes teichomyceticus TaxID=1867 RepID=A0A561VLN6_ACTTI|nr:universal stress protein [Actinoplanes teichomyceticus]TWG12514.1 universal stress protein family protein [Actinoplanes teichomyceticus]GIF13878.1 hypothetical protein Ate01nite_39100 [Actinoplanes teichomyceticus]